jgi:multiple sugar transport system permease protein
MRSSRMSRRARREVARRTAACVVLAVMLFPVYWMVISALKTDKTLFTNPPYFYPPSPQWGFLWNTVETYARPLLNSAIISVGATILALLVCVPGAYALAKMNVPYRLTNVLLVVILAVQVFPTIMLVPPLYQMATQVQALNHYWTLAILDTMYSVPFGLLVLRTFMLSVPDSLREAALVDGATESRAFLRVIIPNAKPGIATVMIFAFLFAWGDFVFGLTFTNGNNIQPVTVSLYDVLGQNTQSWELLMALGTLLAVPAVLAVLGAQRALQQGVAGFGVER